jgi:hypothetical protein
MSASAARRLRRFALALAGLAACAGEAQRDAAVADAAPADSGPIAPPSPPPIGVACEQYEAFARACTARCSPTWSCFAAYGGLDAPSQAALESCADCLLANLADGACADCADSAAGIASCRAFMEQLLAADCW